MKKRKLNFGYVANLGYFEFRPATVQGIKGIAYLLCSKLTEDQKKEILSYQNTKITTFQYRWAPEIKHDVIFLGNKCFS